jgi:hypothetical protein
MFRKLIVPVVLVSLVLGLVVAGCGVETRASQTQTKGMELYSWQDESGEWRYSLLTGKNSLWPTETVKAASVDLEGLQSAMAQLAVGEQVIWEGYDYPPAEVTEALQRSAVQLEIVLVGGPYD